MISLNYICNPMKPNDLVRQSMVLRLNIARAKYYLKWCSVNIVVFVLLVLDINWICSYPRSYWYYVEYVAAAFAGLNILAYFCNYIRCVKNIRPVQVTKEQKELLRFEGIDNPFITLKPGKDEEEADYGKRPQQNMNNNISRGANPSSWFYPRTTPPRQSLSPQQQLQLQNVSWNSPMMNNSMFNNTANQDNSSLSVSPYQKYERDEHITDYNTLQQYLKDISRKEYRMAEIKDINPTLTMGGSINSFWSYCNTTANLLKTSLYQLAPSEAPPTQSKHISKEEGGLNITDNNSEIIKRISSERLAQYVRNLRMWISFTILQRLSEEIGSIDEYFRQRGYNDIQIGGIGLEILRKTAESQQFVTVCMPMLPVIVAFLEMSSNQEYLVQRIKDMAKGSCIEDYRWNSGSAYHGLKWDEHLPTDSSIIFQLFCVYLDSQLIPLPKGRSRPFYSRYVVIGEEKRSVKDTVALVHNKAHCAILCTNPLKPKFNFISDGEIHNCAYFRNNLFYVIIQFLIYMRNHQQGYLEGVNLGKSGINIMCVIED